MVASSYDTRPREERDYKDVYGDLDETAQLPVLCVSSSSSNGISQAQTTSRINKPSPLFTKRRRTAPQPASYPRAVAEYGFRTPRPGKISPTYIRAHTPEVKRRVQYDMDEQDALYLAWRNKQPKNHAVIVPEVFEIVMSVLEQEWHNLELQMGGIGSTEQELTLDESFDKYGSDDGVGGAGSISEQRCAVCNDSECDNANAIVFCDGCNIAVHQECYGIAFIPEGQWFCRRCMLSRGRTVECTFCASHTGAFKQLDNGLWSHVVCALWIHEVYFANPIYMEPIEGISMIPRTRWKLVCYICKQRTGACIQCTNRNCFQAYHVTCGKRAGLYMAMEKGVQGALVSKALLKSFCDRHGPPEWDREVVLRGIAKTRTFYRDRCLLSQQNDRLASQRRQENRRSTFKWRTENNTPIAPQKFADIVFSTLLQLKVETTVGEVPVSANTMLRGLGNKTQALKLDIFQDLRVASGDLCKYWCLKRESKKGAPLVRPSASNPMLVALAAQMYETSNELGGADAHRQLVEKIEFGHTLVTDLRKVVELAQLTRYRQDLARQATTVSLAMADTAYFPLKPVALSVLAQMSDKLDGSKVIANYRPKSEGLTLREIVSNVALYKYSGVAEIDSDIRRFGDQIAHEHKPTSALGKAAARWLAYWSGNALAELSRIENCPGIPFAEVQGMDFKLKCYDPRKALADAGLSESEDDPMADGQNMALFRRFMNAQ